MEGVAGRRGQMMLKAWSAVNRYCTGVVNALDEVQQRHRATAVPVAIIRKFSDDRGGRLAGQIAYASFMAVFPMLLVLLTGLGVVLKGHKQLQEDIVNSAVRQFPIVGSDIANNVHQLSAGSAVGLYVGLVWLIYGALRLSRSAQLMMARVWGIDRDDLPNFWVWLPKAAGFLVILGVGFIGAGALAGLGAFGGLGGYSLWIGVLGSFGVNVSMFGLSYWILVDLPRHHRMVWPGALVGGSLWTLLQVTGAHLVAHQLRHLSSLYGTFATVLGLMWWLALGASISVYSAELNAVLAHSLWPRSLRRDHNDPEPASSASSDGPST